MNGRNKGFTLIELMIVVAIIGILAVIAIPNFLTFASKTRRTEVRYNLVGIYKAELAWYGENNSFESSFDAIRWRPDGKTSYSYSVGNEVWGKIPADALTIVVPGAGQTSFTAAGWGNIDSDATVDIWHIDEMKDLVNDQDDILM